ncbi:MAG: hypothetical protein AAGF12_07280 [Myxococcota bacterium]
MRLRILLLLVGGWFVSAWLVCGCTVETQIRLVLDEGGAGVMVATYEVQLLPGTTCPTADQALARDENNGIYERGALEPIGDLAEGSYALSVIGRGADCDVLLFGCTVFETSGDAVEVALTAPELPGQACNPSATCELGRCQPGTCNTPCGPASLTACAGDSCSARTTQSESYEVTASMSDAKLGFPLSAAVTTGLGEPTVHLAYRRDAGQITNLMAFPYTSIVEKLLAPERGVSVYQHSSVDSAVIGEGEVLEYVYTANQDDLMPPPLLYGGSLTDPGVEPGTSELRFTGDPGQAGSYPVSFAGAGTDRRVVFLVGTINEPARWVSLSRDFTAPVIREIDNCVMALSTNTGPWISWLEGPFEGAIDTVEFWRVDDPGRTASLPRGPEAHAFTHLGGERYLLALVENSIVNLRTFECGDSCGIPAEPRSEWSAPGELVDVLALPFPDGSLIVTAGPNEIDAHILTPDHQFSLAPQRLYATPGMRQVGTMEGVVFDHLGKSHLVLFVMLEDNDGINSEIILVHTQFG